MTLTAAYLIAAIGWICAAALVAFPIVLVCLAFNLTRIIPIAVMVSLMLVAYLSVCLAAQPAQCIRKEFRVEPRACHLPAYRAALPVGGEWRAATVRIVCGK